jgi:uncharacterized membrane protein
MSRATNAPAGRLLPSEIFVILERYRTQTLKILGCMVLVFAVILAAGIYVLFHSVALAVARVFPAVAWPEHVVEGFSPRYRPRIISNRSSRGNLG